MQRWRKWFVVAYLFTLTGKRDPLVVPLSICSNDERMTLRRERSTDFLREARFGRSRVSRRIGTKVSANYILSRVPRERVVIAN